MRAAMAEAEVGDDVLDHDPTMAALEERVAAMLGYEAGLWVPSGTMGNTIALMMHLQRGDSFLAPEHAHVLGSELGTAAWLAQGMPQVLPHDAGPGRPTPAAVAAASGLYIGANFGPGPRDGLMTGIHRRWRWPIWLARGNVEVTVLAAGWMLGGTVGVGTVLFAVLIGPLVHVALQLTETRRRGVSVRGTAASPTPA